MSESSKFQEPLAKRMAPRTLDEFVGQEHVAGPGGILRRAIEADRVSSTVLYGPPGCGKSAVVRVLAKRTDAHVERLNAVTSGVADVRRVMEEAKARRERPIGAQRTLLFIDEIHRFNRTQQDALLPDVEAGTVVLVGATTHNPFFALTSALLSRSLVVEFKGLSEEALGRILDRALSDAERGLGAWKVRLAPEARRHLLASAGGDARVLLNALEVGVLTTAPGPDGAVAFTREVAEASVQKKHVRYDREEDEHYDTVSAFIKSLRGSDPDAALYWMAKMLSAGEDPRFIARRIVICAAEDVGLADPQALVVAQAAWQALEAVGLPEGRIPLAEAAVYVAAAPKSNAAYLALERAMEDVARRPVEEVPDHLKDASRDADRLGHGQGYVYPHDAPGHWVPQVYGPSGRSYYEPTDLGAEGEVKRRLEARKRPPGGSKPTREG